MVKVFEGTDKEYYMDGYLQKNLDIAKREIQKDWDMIFVVDGAEGIGKSSMAIQAAYYCDPTLVLSRIVFTPKEFKQVITSAKQYQAIVYDEAYTGLSSRAAMSLINRTLISVLAEIRQKNLFIFVVCPCFFDLDKYVALWRSRALIHCYTGENFERGFFSFYNVDKKKLLFMLGKKFYTYSRPKANFFGRFCKGYVLDETEYRNKKKKALEKRETAQEEIELKQAMEAVFFEKVMAMGDKISEKKKAEILNMPVTSFYEKVKKWKENHEFETKETQYLSEIGNGGKN